MKLTKEDFLALSEQMYDKMCIDMNSDTQDFYTYESTLDKLMTAFGTSVLEGSLQEGEVLERKKKKSKHDLEK